MSTTENTTTKDPIPDYIAGYARVSSVGQNTGRQLDGIEDYIRERWGKEGVKKAYDTGGIHEEKASGKTAKNRPILQEVISKLRKRDVLIVHSPDRLARSSRDWHNITAELTDKGVHVVYVSTEPRTPPRLWVSLFCPSLPTCQRLSVLSLLNAEMKASSVPVQKDASNRVRLPLHRWKKHAKRWKLESPKRR